MSERIINETGRDQLRWEHDLPQEDSHLKDEILKLRREHEDLKRQVEYWQGKADALGQMVMSLMEESDVSG